METDSLCCHRSHNNVLISSIYIFFFVQRDDILNPAKSLLWCGLSGKKEESERARKSIDSDMNQEKYNERICWQILENLSNKKPLTSMIDDLNN